MSARRFPIRQQRAKRAARQWGKLAVAQERDPPGERDAGGVIGAYISLALIFLRMLRLKSRGPPKRQKQRYRKSTRRTNVSIRSKMRPRMRRFISRDVVMSSAHVARRKSYVLHHQKNGCEPCAAATRKMRVCPSAARPVAAPYHAVATSCDPPCFTSPRGRAVAR